jgi:hypothetical protein
MKELTDIEKRYLDALDKFTDLTDPDDWDGLYIIIIEDIKAGKISENVRAHFDVLVERKLKNSDKITDNPLQ